MNWKALELNGIYKALADPTRRQILALLRQRDLAAGEISDQFSLSKPAISKHLGILKNEGLVQADRNGTTLTYRLNVSVLEEALAGLMSALGVSAGDVTNNLRKEEPS